MDSEHLSYFAYGSNMPRARIEARLGACPVLGVGCLPGYDLRFHKVGRDGSGKCDAYRTGEREHSVHGVLYRLTRAQGRRLDDVEGPGYEPRPVWVLERGVRHRAFTYVARAGHTDPARRPFHWYKEFVLAGAREHGLPGEYLAHLAGIRAEPDPDPARAAENLAILCAAG